MGVYTDTFSHLDPVSPEHPFDVVLRGWLNAGEPGPPSNWPTHSSVLVLQCQSPEQKSVKFSETFINQGI
jgi:hypothetical protein